jgi:hypothetical protein
MKHLREFFAAALLTCVLALSAHAGEISCPGITSPPPDSMTMKGAEIECGLCDVTLFVIQSVLSLA